nr:hypothetical protein CKG001_23630 [Bdellovibrio sp. CKG001]
MPKRKQPRSKDLESKIIAALLSDHPLFIVQSNIHLDIEFSSIYLPSNKKSPTRHKTSLLTIAAAHNKIKSVRRLLEFGASPDGLIEDPTPPLTTAKSIDIVRLLIGFGANPNITNYNNTTSAIFNHVGNREIFNYLINHGADIEMKNCCGQTALGLAISWQLPIDDIAFLVDAGADIYNIGVLDESAFEILHAKKKEANTISDKNTNDWIQQTEELLRLKILAGIIP